MMLTDLADAARSSGLTVVEVAGWPTRGHGEMSGVRAVICHHTAGPRTGDTPSLDVVVRGRTGLPGPLAQLYLSRSGVVHVVAAGLAYHAGVVFVPSQQGNAWAIGIEAEATGVDPWPPGQYAAYTRLCAALCRHYGLGADRVLGHKEAASPAGRKVDPNFGMPQFRAAVAELLAIPPPPAVAPPRSNGDAPVYIKTESVSGGQVWVGLLSGGVLFGPMSPGEAQSAEINIQTKAVPLQWVERATWDLMKARTNPT